MWPEIPALYDVAKQLCHDEGIPWTDPRTGQTYPPPRTGKAKPRKPEKEPADSR